MNDSADDVSPVEQSPDRCGGVAVFRGTRVSVAALFENLRDGATVEEFLEWFPGVQSDDVRVVLDQQSKVQDSGIKD